MNKKQLSEHIGNIDDRLIQQAEKIPNYTAQHRQKRMRQLLATAAALALMVFSFSMGAIAFAREIIIEVPAKQETLELEGVNLNLILPNSWENQYSIEKNGNNFIVYNPQIREAFSDGTDIFDGGVLFTIISYEESMTEEQFIKNGLDFTAYRYLLATSDKTYILHYASDVQYDPTDKEQESTYQKMMSEIEDIQIVVNNIFPPKDIAVTPEGIVEEIEHIAQVKEPEGETPGFAIYVDTERYYMVEENKIFYIRPIGVKENSELICEMEIQEMAGVSWEEAAQTIRNQMCEKQEAGKWDSISDILHDTDIERLHFYVSEGTDWDSVQEEHYFYQMDGQGTYHIVLRYFLEAAEGNGTRFHAMLDTFTPVTAHDTSQSISK